MISNIIHVWKGAAVTGGLALVVGTYGGWKAHSIKTDADKAQALEAAHAAHIEALSALQAELDEANRERLRLSEELQSAEGKTRIVTREIIKEVPHVAPVSTPTCDRSLPIGLVQLHNFAALGTAPDTDAEAGAALGLSNSLPRSKYVSDYP